MGLIVITADKGAPGVTTAAVALAAVWPRPVLLAECDPAGGDIIYRLPSAEGGRLDPRRGVLSLAIAVRRGAQPGLVWEHAQKLRGGLDVLVGVANAEQGAGLDLMWDQVGAALAAVPEADVIADCGRLGADSRIYDLLARADAVVLVTRAHLGDLVRLRDRAAAIEAGIRHHGGPPGRLGALVVADHKHFAAATGDVQQVLSGAGCPVSLIGGLAHEPRSAEMLSGEWGGKLDKTLLIRTARQVAADLAARIRPGPAQPERGQSERGQSDRAQPGGAQPGGAQPREAQPGAGRRAAAQPGPGQPPPGPPMPAQFLPSQSATAARVSGPLPVVPPPGAPAPPGYPPPAGLAQAGYRPPAGAAQAPPAYGYQPPPDRVGYPAAPELSAGRAGEPPPGLPGYPPTGDGPRSGLPGYPPTGDGPRSGLLGQPPPGPAGYRPAGGPDAAPGDPEEPRFPAAYAAAPAPPPADPAPRWASDTGPLSRTGPLPRPEPWAGPDAGPGTGSENTVGPDSGTPETGTPDGDGRDQRGWGEGRGRHAGPSVTAGPGGR